jgi:hypothetical protein
MFEKIFKVKRLEKMKCLTFMLVSVGSFLMAEYGVVAQLNSVRNSFSPKNI